MGFGFGDVEVPHQQALGFFDELAFFDGEGHGLLFNEQFFVVVEAADGDFDLGGEQVAFDGFD